MAKDKDAERAASVRALLSRFTTDGRVDHKAFLAEMDARAAANGMTITEEQYGLLGKIAAAYENELRTRRGAVFNRRCL